MRKSKYFFVDNKRKGIIDKYREYIVGAEKIKRIISLQEGGTPLIPSEYFLKKAQKMGFKGEIYFKHEGLNPTASFKDRGMTVAVSIAVSEGSKAIVCASTGNTSSSAAAYGGRAQIPVFVFVPDGAVALGKMCQAIAHGARIVKVKGNFDHALKIVRDVSERYGFYIVNSINPVRIEGQKTAAFEVIEDLGDAPHYHFLPVGNAGNIWAYYKGYKEFFEMGKSTKIPKMFGFQAEGANPIVRGYPIENPQTIASAIRIGNPANWKYALKAAYESQGKILDVSDREISETYTMMAQREGIFCEPSSAAGVAGLMKLIEKGEIQSGIVVCTLTGHGLKDPDSALNIPQKFMYELYDPKDVNNILEKELQ